MRWNKGGSGDGESSYERPPVGYAVATLAAVYDVGVREVPGSKFGPKHQVCLWWELSHKDSKGGNIGLRDMVTMSLMSGAHLATRVEALLGRNLTDDERDDFDPATILGKSCKLFLAVGEGAKDDANPWVKSAMPLEGNEVLPVIGGDYINEVPSFVGKIVGDELKAEMVKDAQSGGVAGLALCAKPGEKIEAGAQEGQPETKAPPARKPPPSREPKLPEGWTAHKDDESGDTFYEGPNGETQWESPLADSPPPKNGNAPF